MEPLKSPDKKKIKFLNTSSSVEKIGSNIANSIFKVMKKTKFVKGYSFLSKLPSARETVDEIIEARVPVE